MIRTSGLHRIHHRALFQAGMWHGTAMSWLMRARMSQEKYSRKDCIRFARFDWHMYLRFKKRANTND